MKKFAINIYTWFNSDVKNRELSLKDKIVSKYVSRYFNNEEKKDNHKSTDINILLNRVKINQKNESRKKIFFSAAASTGLILFGLIIF
tara:strand:- start:337 stop:600 length:264 start_codon:yes stop_codon:yes gene_type:complete